jgi:DNA/RNA endonuclease YhcR with UshA esterase domain
MRRTPLLAALATALAVATACHTTDVPVGTLGMISVRAFVDGNGDGEFDPDSKDVIITGASVTLTASDGTVQGVVTNASGIATFEDVKPGSYTAAISGALPAGAVLASAATATVVVPFKGGTVESVFRFAYNAGTISGNLYRDDNGNGTFDLGTDTPAPGLPVALYEGSNASTTPVLTTTTGSNGEFRFTPLHPGVYTILITPIPTIQLTGGNTRTVTVGAGVSAPAPIKFTGNLLTTVAAVRAAPVGTTVAFVAVATQNALLYANNNLYVQDATGGVLVFGAPVVGVVAGDTIRIIGVTTLFNGEVEIIAPTGGALSVTKLGTGPVPAPRGITVAQLITHQFAGQLVTVSGAKVRSVVTTSATAYNVNFVGIFPADTFQVRVTNTNNIPILSTFWQVGRAYDVTGVDGIFNNLDQLKPRAPSDVVVGALILGIAAARTHPANDTVTVEGVVYVGTGVLTQLTAANLNAYIQDATGGALLFNIPTGTVYVNGDSLRVKGLVTFFSGEYEIARFTATSPPVIEKLGTGAAIPARVTTGAELASKVYDGMLIKMQSLTVVSIGTVSAAGAYNVVTTALDGASVTVRIDQVTVGVPNTTWTVGQKYDVSGAALNFVSGANTTLEIKPRSLADVVHQ